MPVTTYLSEGELPPAVDYNVTTPPGRTYRYYKGTPLIPFGYGLSYSYFDYVSLTMSKSSVIACQSVSVSISVKNYGEVAGDEVIMVYLKPPTFSDKPFFPKIQLVGFERVNVNSDDTYVSNFEINPYLMSLVDDDGEHYIFPGIYYVRSSQQPTDSDFETLKGNFTITGSAPVKTSSCSNPYTPQCLACKPEF